MSRYPRKIDRAAAERLLRGEPADPRHPDDLLAVLLATAAAPAHAGELAGEEAAVAAFRQARAVAAGYAGRPGDDIDARAAVAGERKPAPRRRWIRHPVRLAIVTVLTATTAGGVALAAASVPWSRQPADQRPAIVSQGPSEFAGPGSAHGLSRPGATATPYPSFVGLCRAYKSGAGTAPGKALDNPAFAALIKAAGGRDNVAAYCTDVLTAEARRAKKSQKSGKSAPPGQVTPPGQSSEAPKSGQPEQSGQFGPTDKPTEYPTVPSTPKIAPTVTPHHTRTPQTRLLSA